MGKAAPAKNGGGGGQGGDSPAPAARRRLARKTSGGDDATAGAAAKAPATGAEACTAELGTSGTGATAAPMNLELSKKVGASSRFLGVAAVHGKWQANAKGPDGKVTYLGSAFATEVEAAEARWRFLNGEALPSTKKRAREATGDEEPAKAKAKAKAKAAASGGHAGVESRGEEKAMGDEKAKEEEASRRTQVMQTLDSFKLGAAISDTPPPRLSCPQPCSGAKQTEKLGSGASASGGCAKSSVQKSAATTEETIGPDASSTSGSASKLAGGEATGTLSATSCGKMSSDSGPASLGDLQRSFAKALSGLDSLSFRPTKVGGA
mmetsp:Transcript_38371/g.86348  ORF Transcript_38371/g.86348 Transcript_38371/m.86348 type:complete len:322 (+) Transcript_38371:87-1052(+)